MGKSHLKIIPCRTEHFEAMVAFVVRLNSDDAHHIGFFGEGEADVRSSLAECVIPPVEGFQLAYDGDRLVGVSGVDADPEISRAWLYGPLVEHEDWHSVADELYAASLKVIPDGIREQDLFCDVRNSNLAAFAERHGFSVRSENAVVSLKRSDYKKPASKDIQFSVIDYSGEFFEQFERCHGLLFPTTYFTARQIVEKLDATRRLFLGLENGEMKGYHFCKVESEACSGYIDFIGVDESLRGRGLGAILLAAGIDWMLSFPEVGKISLTVNADNIPALKLYKNFGFVTERVMRGYRYRAVESNLARN
uniref:GCN5 family acetyltransferase n=1 Tax=uncultured bacterium pAX1 TaxID=1781156 RepID=A0A1C9U4H8_9BACT|nr:GCN5 family acetyltransferase [uncultured bacterium pAX1]